MKKTTFIALFIFAFLQTSGVFAQTNASPFQFLRFNESARAAALAGAVVAMPDDPSALFFNPASLWSVEEEMVTTTYLKHVLDINSGLVSYSNHNEEFGAYAASVTYTNYGSFQHLNSQGQSNGGEFGANDISLALSYSNMLDSNLYYGVTTKFIFVGLEEFNSTALALDAGLLYQMPQIRTNIGMSILHAGMQLSTFADVSERLPLDVRIGANHRLRGLPLLLNFSLHHLADEHDSFFQRFENFSLGGEFSFGKAIQARIGYDNGVRRATSESSGRKLAGLSGGVGIITTFANIDYSISSFGAPATLHRLSLGITL